jgi:hypothetical protein
MEQAKRPQRLFPLSHDSKHFAAWIKKRLAKPFSIVVPATSRYGANSDLDKKKADLGVNEGDSVATHELRVSVYNTARGPRFVIYFD